MSANGQPDPAALARVANLALQSVQAGMKLGLGTGRAAEAMIRELARRHSEGLDVRGVATSERSDSLARELGVPLMTLDEVVAAGGLDVAIDGADEVAPGRALTKGLGGALLRERVVASQAKEFIVLVTPEKLVDKLGERTGVPIEIVPFAMPTALAALRTLGGDPVVRASKDGAAYKTDNGNVIADTSFGLLDVGAARQTDIKVRAIAGVVDTGWFFDMATRVLVGYDDRVDIK